MATTSVNLTVKEIMYTNGATEVVTLTPKQWAGRLRRKGFKKTLLSKKDLATISITIKTKQQ